jgi:hypothetical protein
VQAAVDVSSARIKARLPIRLGHGGTCRRARQEKSGNVE